ncbi:hypothetical protein Lal_00014471 [Lupinus albus]|nr:hypothetical protein Lal_00014471 [Lupinus albus]
MSSASRILANSKVGSLLILRTSGFRDLERIFRAMGCNYVQKVTYASYMLVKEAETWWEFTWRQMETEGRVITWIPFKEKFLKKYFP